MIDAEIATFVAESETFFPPDTARMDVIEQRRLYDAYAAAFAVSRPSEVISEDGVLAAAGRDIGLRRYQSRRHAACGTIVYAHGGGFILGSLDSHDGICARLADLTGATVVSVSYRLAPEHVAPAARDDVLAVTEAARTGSLPWRDIMSGPLLLAGDSAGGTLAASAALVLPRPGAPLAGLALVYPMLNREPAGLAGAEATPMLTFAEIRAYRDAYLGGGEPDPWTFPLEAPSLAGLPPTFLLAAEHDPLRDDCTAFARRLAAAGVTAELHLGRGLVHGSLRALDRSRAMAAAFAVLAEFCRRHLRAWRPAAWDVAG